MRSPLARPPGEPAEWSELEWMRLHLAVLYRFDARGRMVAAGLPQAPPPPRFHLGRTPVGNVWCFRVDEPPEVVRELARLAAREPALGTGAPWPERIESMRRVLSPEGRGLIGWRGPAFRFPEPLEAPALEVVEVGPEGRPELQRDFGDAPEAVARCAPYVVALDAGRAVSRCCVAAGDPAIAAEASLDTLEGHRRQGYGGAVTAAWARLVRARGGLPLYSTAWENRASRAVAARLGLIPYGEDLHLRGGHGAPERRPRASGAGPSAPGPRREARGAGAAAPAPQR